MRVALIVDGRVQEIFASRESMVGKYHASIIDATVDIPDDVQAGYWQTETGWSATEQLPPPTADDFAEAIQVHVDRTARARGYAGGFALVGYSTSTIPAWALEAQTFIAWRDAVWLFSYAELGKVEAGQRSVPTISELISELPSIKWTEA